MTGERGLISCLKLFSHASIISNDVRIENFLDISKINWVKTYQISYLSIFISMYPGQNNRFSQK